LINFFHDYKSQFSEYESIVIYIYKGSVKFIPAFLEIEKLLSKNDLDLRIYLTLFAIPTDKLNFSENRFKNQFENEISHYRADLDSSASLNICFDVTYSIWNKYFDKIIYLPPPLINSIQNVQERLRLGTSINTKENRRDIILALDVWNMERNPKDRFEELSVIEKFIDAVIHRYKNLIIHIKISDSNYSFNHQMYKDKYNHRVVFFEYMDIEQYYNFLKSADIYLLQYSPVYYMNKSSGHFIELALSDVAIIGTKNTNYQIYIEKYKIGACYSFGDYSDLLSTFIDVMHRLDEFKYRTASQIQSLKSIINPWTSQYFYQKVINDKKVN